MKELTADFVRQEVARLGEVVVETAIYHPSGMKLFSAGDTITLAHAKALHASGIRTLYLLEFEEDARRVRKSLGIERVGPMEVEIGDVIMDDLRGVDGELSFPSGTTITSAIFDRVRGSAFPEIVIRDRRLPESMREAQEYFAQLPPSDNHGMSTGTRVTRVVHVPATAVRYLMIPRAHVLVAISDDPVRIFVSNALQSEGHEVIERPSPAEALDVVKENRNITVILLDLEESSSALARLRAAEGGLRDAVILVCAKEGQPAPVQAALAAGANDWLPRPPSRDLLSEKIHGAQALLGRKVHLQPSLRTERRRQERKPGGGDCGLKDPSATKALPVISGEILDQGDGGLRIDYNLPEWPAPWAYMVQGVHPRHFFYTYAYSNPHGRDLVATVPGPAGRTVERPVRVAQVSPSGELEVLSLIFPEVQEQMSKGTAIRKRF